MEYNKLVSVVMPVHNGERFLREAIESVLNQTYTNFEFLIIENCSTDSSLERIKSYDDPRIRIIIEEDCGQVQAYNRGFKEAKGDYIFIHDHDDISHPERFEKQLECMIYDSVDICGSSFIIIDEKNGEIGTIEVPEKHSDIVKQIFYKSSTVFNSTVCLRKNIFNKMMNFNIMYFPSADYEFYLRGISKLKYANVNEYLYFWRKHSKQISTSFNQSVTNISILISLKNHNHFPNKMKNTYIGVVYYYQNKLVKSFLWLFCAIFSDRMSLLLIRHLIIVILFSFPLKLFRQFDLIHTNFFLSSRKYLNKIL